MISHRQSYPLPGCVPTEPGSVSPCTPHSNRFAKTTMIFRVMPQKIQLWKRQTMIAQFKTNRSPKSFLNIFLDRLNTVATQHRGTRTRTRSIPRRRSPSAGLVESTSTRFASSQIFHDDSVPYRLRRKHPAHRESSHIPVPSHERFRKIDFCPSSFVYHFLQRYSRESIATLVAIGREQVG